MFAERLVKSLVEVTVWNVTLILSAMPSEAPLTPSWMPISNAVPVLDPLLVEVPLPWACVRRPATHPGLPGSSMIHVGKIRGFQQIMDGIDAFAQFGNLQFCFEIDGVVQVGFEPIFG
jgi:hypothetical protein